MNRRYNVLGVIPARGGSKGIPRKNLVDLAEAVVRLGQDLGHAVEIAHVGGETRDCAAMQLERLFRRVQPILVAAGDGDGGAVLLTAVDTVGEQVVRIDAVELRRRLVVDARPRLTAVEGDRGTERGGDG